MGIWQIILTLLFYVIMALVLWLLWVTSQRVLQLLQLLTDTALKTAEAALKTAEALSRLREDLKK